MKLFYGPGRYVCRILDHDMGITSNGNPQLVVRFNVIGTPDPKDPSKYVENKVQLERRFFRVLNENTAEWAFEDLKALGFEGDSIAQLSPKHPKAVSFKDVEIDMFCNHESDQKGELRESWSIARGGGPLVQQPADLEKLRKLDYVFKKQLDSIKSGKPQAAAQKASSRASALEITDEDVPF